ncbi:MAG: YXWGXW repeat-containing protein [Polyangiales bacterium]
MPRPPRNPSRSLARLVALAVPPLALVVASTSGMPACGGQWVTGPKLVDHAPGAGEGVCVPYPPPAPKAEEIPERPTDDHVYVDGQWSWQTRRWVWVPGGWVVPPPGASYAQWKTERLQNGAIAYYQGHWHQRSPTPYDANASIVCPAPPKPGSVAMDAPDEVEAHVGPVLVYAADAPSSAPPKVVFDATMPSDVGASEQEPAKLIGPPD